MTSIEWTDKTWNPVVGCSRVSAGCEHCYAESVAHRKMRPEHVGLTVLAPHGKGPRWNGVVRFLPDRLAEPLTWRKPRRVFVNSMSDLFHESVAFEEIAAIFGVMAACPHHTFQVLTKRPERARDFFAWIATAPAWGDPDRNDPSAVLCSVLSESSAPFPAWCGEEGEPLFEAIVRAGWPLPNVDVLASVEDQASADKRVPALLAIGAHVGGALGVSYEPALGAVDFGAWVGLHPDACTCDRCFGVAPGRLEWIIVGGESGPRARPFNVAWARSVINQGADARVPVFVKQLGADVRTRNDDNFTIEEDPPDPDFPGWPTHLVVEDRVEHDPDGRGEQHQGAPVRVHLRDRKGGDPSEWRSDLRVREWPEVRGV